MKVSRCSRFLLFSICLASTTMAQADGTLLEKVEKTVDLSPGTQDGKQTKVQNAESSSRTKAALTQTWIDPATDLMWTSKDNGSDVDWNQATAYCLSLHLEGSSDWHLPTLVELQSIYDSSISSQMKFDNGVTYSIHVKGQLRLTGWDWSSSQSDAPGKPWHFVFDRSGAGNGFAITMSYSMRALCVRHAVT